MESQLQSVFISHASSDKDRFVLPFAKGLREAGVNVWVDQWEIGIGDSLVDKILETGLGEATVVLVVISRVSLNSRWVSEELDVAVMRRINEESRLFPIVLDGISPQELPVSIQHILHERVNSYDLEEVGRVVAAVVRALSGGSRAPELGLPPRYSASVAIPSYGLDPLDALVLHYVGAESVLTYGFFFQSTAVVEAIKAVSDANESQVLESLTVLEAVGIIGLHKTFGKGISGMSALTMTRFGFAVFLEEFMSEYPDVRQRVVAHLGSWATEQGNVAELASRSDSHPFLVDHILETLSLDGLVALSQSIPMRQQRPFYNISPLLKRMARE